MKSNPNGCGNANLKGKKTKVLRCGCCEAINFKEGELKKVHKKEMRNAFVAQWVEATASKAV